MARLALIAAVAIAAGCGNKRASSKDAAAPPPPADAAAPPAIELPALELGVRAPERLYGGDAAARERAAGAVARADWAAATGAARVAVSANSTDAGARWLLGNALAATGDHRGALGELAAAVALDPARYARIDLFDEHLAGFIKSPAGARWRERVAEVRGALDDDLATAVPFVAGVSEVFARAASGRFVRLTDTGGEVIGALPSPDRRRPALAAIAASPLAPPVTGGDAGPPAPPTSIQLRVIAVVAGRAREVVGPAAVERLELFWAAPDRLIVATGESIKAISIATGAVGSINKRPEAITPTLQITPVERRVVWAEVRGVAADWDNAGLADVLRLRRWRKTVTLPRGEPAQRDRSRWASGGERLALVTGACGEPATVHVVEGATGRVETLDVYADLIDLRWLDDRRLVLAVGNEFRLVNTEARSIDARWSRPRAAALHLSNQTPCTPVDK